VESPPKSPVAGYDPRTVDAHRQKYDYCDIPTSIELVLKLAGREPSDFFELQEAWKKKTDGNFIDFDGRTIAGVTFHQRFDDPRGNEFPTEELFKTIDAELEHDRYVIISVYAGTSYHMFVIVGRTSTGDYHAVSCTEAGPATVTNVKARVREMKGTDILTYTIADRTNAAEATTKDAGAGK